MARTNRNGAPNANVQALDNLDLDDMFADGGDDLFDGLDIDLGNMEDITGGNSVPDTKQTTTEPSAPLSSSPAAPDEAPKRRKTKRKTTAPSFFDDQDDLDEEPVKKKKRMSTATKKRGSKKAAATDDSKTPMATSSKKSKMKSTMPPPPVAKVSSGGVAAASNTGGRLKKIGSASKSTSVKATEPGPTAKGTASAAVPKLLKTQPSTQATPHPGLNQSSFCGLLPSKSLFYPFLPSLPQEVALKNRKIYALLDQIHSSFTSHLASPNNPTNGVQQVKLTEPIVQLMQEAFKEEKSLSGASPDGHAQSKKEIIGSSVASIRKIIESLDKTRLTQDLLAVCALLQRQHDFLKQNAANMERWCRDNFSEDDFAEVYLPPNAHKKNIIDDPESLLGHSILSSLSGSTCKVRVLCSGFKEPKTGLRATIPAKPTAIISGDPKKAIKPTKKRKSPPEEPNAATSSLTLPPASYAQLRPAKRRKAVADLITQAACTLEFDYAKRIERLRQSFASSEKRAREAAEDPHYLVAHTAGMWKWLEEMGFCEDTVDETTLRDRLDDIRSLNGGEHRHAGGVINSTKALVDDHFIERSHADPPTSFFDNLLSLLVNEDDCADNESYVTSSDDEEIHGIGEDHVHLRHLAELSGLSLDERTHLQLRAVGLTYTELQVDPESYVKTASIDKKPLGHPHLSTNGESEEFKSGFDPCESSAEAGGDTIETMIEVMKADLLETTKLNHQRGSYLEAMVRSTLDTPLERNCRKIFETDLNSRHAALVKRNKEAKAKTGKIKNTKNDDLALPW
ncbi:hypothetical protein ACA910_016630 [Epithemia clementina (nom. ined.)]